jgi:hypothetical protein
VVRSPDLQAFVSSPYENPTASVAAGKDVEAVIVLIDAPIAVNFSRLLIVARLRKGYDVVRR